MFIQASGAKNRRAGKVDSFPQESNENKFENKNDTCKTSYAIQTGLDAWCSLTSRYILHFLRFGAPTTECSHATAAPTHSHSTWCFFNRKPRWRAILMTGMCCYLSSNLRRTLNLYIPFVLQLIYSLFGWLPSARLLLSHYQFPHLFLFHTIPLWLLVLLSWESRSGSYSV